MTKLLSLSIVYGNTKWPEVDQYQSIFWSRGCPPNVHQETPIKCFMLSAH